jgi:hypothetical protein
MNEDTTDTNFDYYKCREKFMEKRTRLKRSNPRSKGTNPRAKGTNPNAMKLKEEFEIESI